MDQGMPTVGRIVHYQLNEADAAHINRMRGERPEFGNHAREGQTMAAMVVATFGPGATVVNLQVILDGVDSYWATSRREGDGPGTWTWPPRA